VLYTSGYGSRLDVDVPGGEAQDDFIPKPFTPDALSRRVRHLLDLE
jgi:DNA-binding response OmpR family regulator